MQSRLTANCLPQYADFGKLLRFLRSLDPVSVVCGIDSMNAAALINQIASALPNAEIIGRFIFPSDGGMHLKPQAAGDTRQWIVSPGDALNAWGILGTNTDGTHRRKLYLVNEPQANGALQEDIGRLVQWTIETIGLATTRGISLCVLNFGVGHPALLPSGEYDARFDDVLTILSKQRDLHTLGMHVYQPADTFARLDGVISRCKALGIKPPRVHITESGFDAGSGGDALNGYKSRNYSGQQFAAFQIDKIKNVYRPYFAEDSLQSVATFVWGGEASWHAFNVETDTDWQATILDAANKGLLSVTPTPPTVTPQPKPAVNVPAGLGIAKTITILGSTSWHLRTDADPAAPEVGLVKVGEAITIYPETITSRVNNWYFVQRASAPAGESANGWIAYVIPVTGPLPAPPVIVDSTPPVSVPYPEVSAAYARGMAKAYNSLATSYKLMSDDSFKTAEQWTKLADVIDGKLAA